jgi:hypothetical protein
MSGKTMLSEVQMNVAIDMNDLVNIFVSKFEEDLIAKRDDVQKEVKSLQKDITDVIEKAKSDVQKEAELTYNVNYTQGVTKVTVTVQDNIDMNWEKSQASITLKYTLTVGSNKLVDNNTRYDKDFLIDINESVVRKYNKLMDKKQELLSELSSVNNELKDIGRKERRVRAVIAERKVSEAGYSELIHDKELVKLISLD